MRQQQAIVTGIVLLFAMGLTVASSELPAFGPQTFEVLGADAGPSILTFGSATAGPYVLYVRNGDAEGSRVTDAVIRLNGTTVVAAGELTDRNGLTASIELVEGDNELAVDLSGNAGSFVTLAIGRPERPLVFAAGRLLLPWARSDVEVGLALALKNGSLHAPRALRVVFFDAGGQPVAASERLVLPPRASLARAVETLIDTGSFETGSVEIYWAGPGAARLFGTARQFHRETLLGDNEALQLAGYQIHRGRPGASDRPDRPGAR